MNDKIRPVDSTPLEVGEGCSLEEQLSYIREVKIKHRLNLNGSTPGYASAMVEALLSSLERLYELDKVNGRVGTGVDNRNNRVSADVLVSDAAKNGS